MKIILYKNIDSDNTLNKTLTEPLEIPINLKNDIDIINPEIRLMNTSNHDYLEYNYCHIPMLNRYYFIESMDALNPKITTLRCSCDVLTTYKDDILQCSARLKRNIRSGDYMNVPLNESVIKNITKYDADVQIGTDESIILTSIGA